MELSTHGHMIDDPIHGQIPYNYSLSNAFKLILEHNFRIFLVEMRIATAEESAEHIIKLANVIPTVRVKTRYTRLPIIIHRLCNSLRRLDDCWQKRMMS